MLPLDRQNAYRRRYAQQRPGWRSSGDEFESTVRAAVTPTSAVLDLGCGRGGLVEQLWPALVPHWVGLDPDFKSLHEHRLPALPRVQGWGDQLPFANATFEVVLGLWVLEHVPRPAPLFAELRRVLRPGGRFIFLTPNARHPLIFANRYQWALPAVQKVLIPNLYGRKADDTFQVHYRANTEAALRTLAAQAGLRLTTLRPIADPTYLAFNDVAFSLSCFVESWLPSAWGVHLLGVCDKQ